MKQPRIQITDAKNIAKRLNADGVAVFAFVDGRYQAASYGETKLKCEKLGAWLDAVCDQLNSGKLPAPEL
mgnify:CR=1